MESERARTLANELQGEKQRAEASLAGLCAELRSGEVQLLNAYVQLSPQCAELFALWQRQESGDGNRIAALVIETLASVLEGGFDEGARTAKTRQGVAGRILSEHLQLLYRYMGTERDQLLKACLRLLAGVSSVSQSMSSQLLRTFNFAHEGFARLSQRRHQASKKDKGYSKEPPKVDTRTFFSRFATSFLRWKDPSLTSAALGIKDLVGGVLRGLSQDPPQEALAFVHDIMELVVRQRQLPRQTKVFFFNAFALRNLASLLGSEDKQVSSTASMLLREVCCNASLFPASKDAMLLDVCLELRAHEAQQDFVAAVLHSRPRLHLQFCARLKLPLQPRMIRTWFRSVGFLAKLLRMDVSSLRAEASALVGPVGASGTEASAELRMSWLQEALVPHAMHKGLITQALLQPKPLLQLGALVLLLAALERLQRALRSADCMPTEREDLQNRIQARLPDLNTLLLLWQKLSKDGETSPGLTETPLRALEIADAENEEQTGGEAVSEAQVLEEDVVTLLDLPGPLASHTIFTTWCKTAQRYVEVLPQSAADVKFDWSKLLSAVASPVLSGQGPPLSAERLRACVQCVGAAMQARSLSLQLSKSQRAWLETLLRLRSASDDELCSDCTKQLVRFIGDRKVCGQEQQVELQKLLAATKKWPQSVGFFCQALQSVLLRPGFFLSEIEENAYDSLLLLALVRQLARREPQGLGLPSNAAIDERRKMAMTCAKMAKQSVVQIAMQLPATAQPLAALVRGSGEWIAGTVFWGETQPKEDAAVAPQGDPEGAEGVRQSLLEKLEGIQKSQKRKREETEVNGEGLGGDAAVTAADALQDTALQPFLRLDAHQRSQVLRTLASRSDSAAVAALNKVLSSDSESPLRLALMEPTQFTPPDVSLTSGVAVLLERLCHLNPKLREAVASQLSWRTGSPATILRLAAALAPLETVAWLEEAPPSPSELLPLPKEDHLVELFATTRMPVLEKTVLQALDAKEKPHAGATRSRRLQLRLELRRGNSTVLGSALGKFLDVVGPMKAADHKLVTEALKFDKLVFSSAEEALKQYVEDGVAGSAEQRQSAATLLGVLQVQAGARPWQVTAARRLITDAGAQGEVFEWMLEHAVCWWPDLFASQPEKLQDFVQCVQTSYGASCSRGDLLRRQLLVAWAAEDASVSIQVPREASEQEPWAFRAWVGKLESWVPVWGWDLDARRLRTTTESFSFERSSIDPLPRRGAHVDARQERPKETESEPYDIAYLLPFFAGQLRAAFMQSGDAGASKAAWGPALGALMCGGALELLLLGLACCDTLLRACAFEALSVVTAMAQAWNISLEEVEKASRERLPFRELPELARLLCYVRDAVGPEKDGIPGPVPRLSASFLAACAPILTQPQHALYRTVAKFLLGRPAADFEDIPLFSKLMLSGDVESSQEARLWYLRVLRRGLAVKSGAFTAADKLSRQAMARRNVLPWIMSFAGSKELGSLPVFLEAAGCVEAALQAPVVSAEGAALKLSVAEWATAQAARAPQRGNRNHAQQVLRAVGRIVSALLRIPGDDPARSRVLTSSHTQLLAIGRAVQSCAAAWVRLQEPTSVEGAAEEEVPASEAATQVPVALLWEQVCILARLATEKRKAAGNVSDEPEAKRPRNAEDMSLAAQLDSVLWLVAQLEEGFQAVALPRASECLLAVSLRRREPSGSLQELLLITFTFVQVSPLSPLVHELFGQLVRYLLAQGEHGRHNLHVQEEAITSAFQVLMAMSNKDLALSSEAKESLRRLVCTFLSLPHSVDFAGRLHLLANAILLALQPPDSRLQRLLEQLPSPEAALSRGAAKDSGPLLIDLLKEQLFQSTEPPNEKKRRTKDARIGQGPFDVRV